MPADFRFNCWELQARQLLGEWNLELLDVFPMFWKTPLSSSLMPKSLGEALRSVNYDIVCEIENAFDLKIVEFAAETFQQLLSFMAGQLDSGAKVLAFADAFHCEWSPAYGKYHNNHFVIVRSIDFSTGTLVIDDLFHDATQVQFKFAAFEQARGTAFAFVRHETGTPVDTNLGEKLDATTAASVRDYGRSASEISQSLAPLLEAFNYAKEIEGFEDNWWASPAFSKLSKIENTHWNIAHQYQEMDSKRAAIFLDLAKEWGRLKLLLMSCETPAFVPRMQRSIAKVLLKIDGLSDALLHLGKPSQNKARQVVCDTINHERNLSLFGPLAHSEFGFVLDNIEARSSVPVDGMPINFDIDWASQSATNCFRTTGQVFDLSHHRQRKLHVLYTRLEPAAVNAFHLETESGSTRKETTTNSIFVQDNSKSPSVFFLEASETDTIISPIPKKMAYFYALKLDCDPTSKRMRLICPDDPNLIVLGVSLSD